MTLVRGPWFLLGFTDRSDGDAKQEKTQNVVLSACGLARESLTTCKQVHGDRIVSVAAPESTVHTDADGLTTAAPGAVLGIFTADCVPVFVMNAARRKVAALHAGWRGTQKGIVLKGAREALAAEAGKPEARIGPHIRDCCYEVGPEVARQFPEGCLRRDGDRLFLSLEKAIRLQLREAGVPESGIAADPACTHCDARFYSYRRDKGRERMLSFISIF